ncbi:Nuclear actin-protein involved in chromatin remodeling [Tieghemiomyces parasiticus]|uniref:Nuclear actin-protein involved in chromatin remodeling n=1 Tax=Tieghemiomyces parasiticus TaxID=78921 RepID=A0A9W8AD17_9FUNG|nr:Nuclear actin-protein involved in chromatin remodeling [Tieghemiomyces parasiticus]
MDPHEDAVSTVDRIYEVPTGPPDTEFAVPQTDYEERWQGTDTPLVIDFGSWHCRAGWAAAAGGGASYHPTLDFENGLAKVKDRRSTRQMVVVGNDMYANPSGRMQIKSPFDAGVVCNAEPMEQILDYTLLQLGIHADRVEHPVLMTEPLCVPLYHRQLVSELLFEGYRAPSVVYGVDSLYSYYGHHGTLATDGLVLSLGHAASHVIPVAGGRPRLDLAKRLAFSGQGCVDALLKLLQLKYPTFPDKVSTYQAQYMVHHDTYFATDYKTELAQYEDPAFLATHDRVVQFPFTVETPDEKSEEELARLTERRREQMRKMQEMAAKSRLEKLVKNEQDLESYVQLRETRADTPRAVYLEKVRALGFRNEAELDQQIKKLEQQIEKARNKDLGIEKTDEGPPSFPLLDTPDDQLTEAERREKRKQRLLKAGYDARERARRAKEEEKRREEERELQEEERRRTDLQGWLDELKRKRTDLQDKIERRQQLKQQLADRRSHISQMRMKAVSALASNENGGGGVPIPPGLSPSESATSNDPQAAATATAGGAPGNVVAGRRRRRGPSEDTFGADDSDWAVYREISKEEGSGDEEEEEQDQAILVQYEELLHTYDPTYLDSLHRAAQDRIRQSTLYKFGRGVSEIPEPGEPEEIAQAHQIHLNVERIRVPETLFQPAILGVEQAGLVEVVEMLLKCLDPAARGSVSQNLYLTGGSTLIPNLAQRLEYSVQSILPTGARFQVTRADDPLLSAWQGAARWANTADATTWGQAAITRADYDECGASYLKEHALGNRYYRSQ